MVGPCGRPTFGDPRACARGQLEAGSLVSESPGFRPGQSKGGPSCLRIPVLAPGVSKDATRSVVSNHRAYQLYAHITWHTWKRVGCLDLEAARDVSIAVASAGRRASVSILRTAVLADHVHVLVSFRPDTRLSDFIRLAKTISAFRSNSRIPGAVRWARGFFIASLHRRDLARVDEYIARQYQHHRDRIPAVKRLRTGSLTPGASPGNTGGEALRLTPGASPGSATAPRPSAAGRA